MARRALEPRARAVGGARPRAHHQGPVHEPAGRRGQRRGAPRGAGRGGVDRGHAGRGGGAAQPVAGGGGGVQGARARRPARVRDDRRCRAPARPVGSGVRAPSPGAHRRHDHLRPRLRGRLRSRLDLLGAGGRPARRRRRRRGRGHGTRHRRHQHPARVLRDGGRGDPRRRRRPRWPADRLPSGVVRGPEGTARRLVTPHANRVAAGLQRARGGRGTPPRRRRGGPACRRTSPKPASQPATTSST